MTLAEVGGSDDDFAKKCLQLADSMKSSEVFISKQCPHLKQLL